MSRVFSVDARAKDDRYRWGLTYEEELFCDTVKVHERLVIGVMSPPRRTTGLTFLQEVEPAYRRKVE